jgi:hypothetical protein
LLGADLHLWYRGDSLTVGGGGGDGDIITNIPDKSANSRNGTSVLTREPLYRPSDSNVNGMPVLDVGNHDSVVDAVDVTFPSGISSQDLTVWAVLNPKGAGSLQYLFDVQTSRTVIAAGTSGSNVGIYDGAWREVAANTTGWQYLVWQLVNGTNTMSVRRNGASIGTATHVAHALGATGGIRFGCAFNILGSPFLGLVAEFGIAAHQTGVNLTELESYFSTRYGL